jgi:hypothetical protein
MLFGSSDNSEASLRPKLVITYLLCPEPVANFTYIVIEPVVQFYDSSSSASSWYWNFGDGYFSDLKNPVHNYSQFGKYYTCLTVTDSCGSGHYCDTVYYCRPPDPGFSYSVNGHFVSFTDSSFSPERWYWSFGDNFFSDLQNPTHYYQNPGTYYVCLTSANVCNQRTFCDSVIVQPSGVGSITGEKISIYPVPATDHITIDWLNPQPGTGEISILNPGGITVFKNRITIPPTDYHQQLDLRALSSGIYFLRIMTGNKIIMDRFVLLR